MQISVGLLVLSALSIASHAHGKLHCVTEGSAAPGLSLKTVHQPVQTVTLIRAAPAVQQPRVTADKQAGATQQTAATPTVVGFAAANLTRTVKAVVATTTIYVTTGPTGGTTTVTSYTLNVPQPSLARRPVLQRALDSRGAAPLALDERGVDSSPLHFSLNNTGKTNGVDRALFTENDDDPNDATRAPRVYCHERVTKTVNAPAVPATLTARATLEPRQAGTVTVTVTPTTKIVTKVSTVAAPAAATVVVGGLDVCNPVKFSQLYDWTAYQARPLAWGLTSLANVSDPASCCAAAANVPGALAWAVCNADNASTDACSESGRNRCYATYLKRFKAAGVTAAQQCVAGNNATTFQYRTGKAQTCGPLQCASTYEPYTCIRPILLLLGDLICFKT
ncbi:hypothetical protein V8E36_009031 [Tilletia maclaganii]